jgi:predicted transposase/invertase (TIGR01784 family)
LNYTPTKGKPVESDSFFYQLFQQLPRTFFELLGLSAMHAKSYRFASVELKKAFRIDGLFVPKKRRLPIYFVEVQFQRLPTFYANLFAKVFSYLEENDPTQEWIAVAIFPTRKEEPKKLGPYDDLLKSPRVKRVYLQDVTNIVDPPIGLGLLKLLFATETEAEALAPEVARQAELELADSELSLKVVELVERLLILRFPQYG